MTRPWRPWEFEREMEALFMLMDITDAPTPYSTVVRAEALMSELRQHADRLSGDGLAALDAQVAALRGTESEHGEE